MWAANLSLGSFVRPHLGHKPTMGFFHSGETYLTCAALDNVWNSVPCKACQFVQDNVSLGQWFRLHTAQKVGSVGRENILFFTKKIFSRTVKQVQNSEAWVGRHAELVQ